MSAATKIIIKLLNFLNRPNGKREFYPRQYYMFLGRFTMSQMQSRFYPIAMRTKIHAVCEHHAQAQP